MNYLKLRFIKRSLLLWIIIFGQFFTSLPVIAFSATSFTPADNGTAATLGTNLSITFDETPDITYSPSGYITIHFSNGSIFQQFYCDGMSCPGAISTTGYDLIINPSSNLPAGESLYVRIVYCIVFDWNSYDY